MAYVQSEDSYVQNYIQRTPQPHAEIQINSDKTLLYILYIVKLVYLYKDNNLTYFKQKTHI